MKLVCRNTFLTTTVFFISQSVILYYLLSHGVNSKAFLIQSDAFILKQLACIPYISGREFIWSNKNPLFWILHLTYISRLCLALPYDFRSPKSWKTSQAGESVITSDRNTSCQLPCHLPLSLPQRSAAEAFVGHSRAYGIPLNSWSAQRSPWSYNCGLLEQTADSNDIYLRPFWLLPSPALFSVERCQLTFRWVSGSSTQIWGNSSNCPI